MTVVNVDVKALARYIEAKARKHEFVTYGELVAEFRELPPLTENWHFHPLCNIFGDFDREDYVNDRPWRTALVINGETKKPGRGFFEAIVKLRKQKICAEDKDAIWIRECNKLFGWYETH